VSSLTTFNDAVSNNEAQNVDALIQAFNRTFSQTEQTVLAHSADEPIYIPANSDQQYHTIYFAHGYFSSALHEMSHWLVAGKARRQLEDFGYWYKPDGRSESEQQAFEQVEIKPQAIEWFLAKCCGHTFHFSADNLSAGAQASDSFKRNVYQQVKRFAEYQGMEQRMANLVKVLTQTFSQPMPCAQDFVLVD
jgi:elongation factor P hydroxylase